MKKETFTCAGCGVVGHWLEEFPKSKCLECHAADPVVQHELETMTAEKLAKLWGDK